MSCQKTFLLLISLLLLFSNVIYAENSGTITGVVLSPSLTFYGEEFGKLRDTSHALLLEVKPNLKVAEDLVILVKEMELCHIQKS